ncbi:hypothetical protein N7448_007140 [Penicillium atrosanguineum]|uniref:Uncharacterized protein n=1 Tax=Penicillium atrosanguineum TaxID=1132637 RepID=A0A9W9GZL8_9EURO|nr:Glyceraldehyde-3-phosphate dehydrogenase 1 [Penicillium atrosanguineum]KAJ5132982.1 hypothetical protein N7448_007140 [Penicillium atrosanguineum]KAJ5141125.1 hypothetical protein N7526_002120 [Penicillium atrosanguineum]KAJ5290649.1 Glyceraldehyde-3-phosphate dehydrogenase 1 [Penicillium atrosanguineum]KAJ5308473.1 hypothetical protein N7476_009129 [Penicillium atrosanguineum]
MSDVTNSRTPASGRGLQLNKRQEEALIRISKERQGTNYFSEHSKAFWLEISKLLLKETGRVYSWQSCRRRMTAWESPIMRAPCVHREKPSYPREELEEVEEEATHSSAITRRNSSPPVLEERDNDLPHPPFILKRAMNSTEHPVQQEIIDLHCNVIDLVQCTMTSLEAQVKCLTNILATNKNSCEAITDALHLLKGEVTKAISDYERSN